ncbi:MAG: ABC transporter ATP-binding protein, partial [Bacilli bacterium]|nr:ABC transporter ATP-binding protein [Bacilli bacterium]
MLKLLKYLKKYWFYAILAPLFMMLEVGMDIVLTNYMQVMVDDGIQANNLSVVIDCGWKMLVIVLIGVLGGILSGVFTNLASYKFSNALRKDLFKKIMNLSYDQTDDFSTGSLVTRVTNDITQVQNFISMSLRMLVRALSFFVMGIIATIGISSKFAYVIAILLALELVVMLIFMFLVFPKFGVLQKQLDRVNTIVHENVSGARVVKTFSKEEYEEKRFNEAIGNHANTNYFINKLMAFLNPVLTALVFGAQIVIYWLGGTSIQHMYDGLIGPGEAIMVGEIAQANSLISMIFMSVMMLGMTLTNLVRAAASAKRINEVLDAPLDIKDGDSNFSIDEANIGTIEFKNVSFKYPRSSNYTLEDVSIKISAGEKLSVVGLNGAGKTTFIKLL